MKKAVLISLAIGMLTALGGAFAQPSPTATHDLFVKIPGILGVRLVDAGGNSALSQSAAAVDFDYSANKADYMAAVQGTNADPGYLAATNASGTFDHIIVFSNGGGWVLKVKANELTDGVSAPAGLAIADVKVTPHGSTDAVVTSLASPFNLSTTEQEVASGGKTTGWHEVGIGGDDYKLFVNGDEQPGTWQSVVTYTIYSN